MKISAYTLDAFAKTSEGGNPAGVVLNADFLTEQDMKDIAKEINFSETAFIMKSDVADFKLRFFTPLEEVNLCGHATIASFYLLKELGIIEKGTYTQETKAGLLKVHVLTDGSIMMEQNVPEFYLIANKDEIALSLNIDVSQFIDAPCHVVSTGISDMMVGIKKLEDLLAIKPDFNQVAMMSEKYNSIGYHLFSLESIKSDIHTRSIAPLIGIKEEAATGTANGALACYLYHYGLIDKMQAKHLVIEQGYILGRPSEIIVSLKIEDDKIIGVSVGGKGKNIKEIVIEI